jgi:hypothetical protein
VALLQCGESHEDAHVDVTRKRGTFEAKEGWIEIIKKQDMNMNMTMNVAALDNNGIQASDVPACCRIMDTTKKSLPVKKIKRMGQKTASNKMTTTTTLQSYSCGSRTNQRRKLPKARGTCWNLCYRTKKIWIMTRLRRDDDYEASDDEHHG